MRKTYKEKRLSEILGKDYRKHDDGKDPTNMFDDPEDRANATKLLAQNFKDSVKKPKGADWLLYGMKPIDFDNSTMNPRLK